MINAELIPVLEDPKRFHYKDLWSRESNNEKRKILELFAFGNFDDLDSQLAEELTEPMFTKLRQLTMISLSEKHREVSYDLIRQRCHLKNSHDIETMLIQLRDIFQVKLDSVRERASFIKCYDCRDVYGHEEELIIVNEKNITTRDKLLTDLLLWKHKLRNEILDV